MIQRRKRNSSKVNLTISVIFHTALVLTVFFLAAREGMLGKKLKEITVTMVPKDKKPEPPKEKPAAPKVQPPKMAEAPKPAATAPPKVQTAAAPAPDEAPSVAPAQVNLPSFSFGDGAKEVQTASDPNEVYKGLIEYALRSRWIRPDNLDDARFSADIQLSIDPSGDVTGYHWVKGSGNRKWDDSVKEALAETKSVGRKPPKGFPETFTVRFDVETVPGEGTMQLSSR